MSKIPLPERGQPLDVTYMYQMANAINSLSEQMSSSTYNYTSVKTRDASIQNVQTGQSRVIAGFYDVVSNTNVLAGTTTTFNYAFQPNFKYPPIVVATPVNSGNTPVGNDVTVTVTDVSTSSATILVKFNSTGTMSISVNLIAIGIPA